MKAPASRDCGAVTLAVLMDRHFHVSRVREAIRLLESTLEVGFVKKDATKELIG